MIFLRSIAGKSLSEFKFTSLNLRTMGIENSNLALRRQIVKIQRECKTEIVVDPQLSMNGQNMSAAF